MLGIFKRLFRVAEAETHAAIDKIEDPIKLTEQGIRDLKKDLGESLKSLAQAKAVVIKIRRDSEEKKSLAASYEKKAVLLLKKAESGDLDPADADRLATESLAKKEQCMTQALTFSQSLQTQDQQMQKLESSVQALKQNISKWENELTTLKARAKVASASKKLNKHLANIDSNSTISLLEKMKTRVSEDEALATSYSELASVETNIDDEINKAIAGSTSAGGAISGSSDSLAALKAKLKSGDN